MSDSKKRLTTTEEIGAAIRDAVAKASIEPPLSAAEWEAALAEERTQLAALQKRLDALVEANHVARQKRAR